MEMPIPWSSYKVTHSEMADVGGFTAAAAAVFD
jgi:hypothetical protein